MRTLPVAYILWFFLGPLGVHRFYCGRIGTGFLWLFTGGLAGIGWIVDAFLMPSLVEQANEEWYHERRVARGAPVGHPAVVHAPEGAPPPGLASTYRVIYCTHCGAAMQVPADAVGRHYACPRCRTVLEVPG